MEMELEMEIQTDRVHTIASLGKPLVFWFSNTKITDLHVMCGTIGLHYTLSKIVPSAGSGRFEPRFTLLLNVLRRALSGCQT